MQLKELTQWLASERLYIAFALLCTLVGLCAGLAFNWPVIPLCALGLVAGSLPLSLPPVRPQLQPEGLAETISLTLLVAISIGVCLHILLPILNDQTIQIEAVMPLLFLVPPLYLTYIILNHMAADRRATSVTSHLRSVFSGPPMILSVAVGATLATYGLLVIQYVQLHYASWGWFADKFLERGIIPPLTLTLFFWGLVLFANKAWMLRRERKLLASAETRGDATLERARQWVPDGGAGVGGGVGVNGSGGTDLASRDKLKEDFLDTVWKKSQDSYDIPRYLNWAIPILGFIGTVLGISLAADGIQSIIEGQSGLSQFSQELGQAIAPLGIAFDTTLIALSLNVLLMLIQTLLHRWENNLLTDYENSTRRRA